jgi:hypothetical protein
MLAIEFALDVRRIPHILNFDDKLTKSRTLVPWCNGLLAS